MSDIDFDHTARLWLQDGPSQLTDRVLDAALDEIHLTRQRRVWGPARRFPSMGNAVRLAALAAVLVLVVAGLNYVLPGDGGLGGPLPTPVPATTLRGTILEGDPVMLEPGTYITHAEFLVRATFTVPAGWEGHLGGPYMTQLARPSGGGELLIFIFDKVYADPCRYEQGYLDPLPGPTVDDLVTALTVMPGLETTIPTDVSIGGYPGKQLTITAPADFIGCTLSPEGYAVWELPLGALYTMGRSQGDRVWAVDVEGQRTVVVASGIEGKSPQVQAEVQGILDSIRFAPNDVGAPSPAVP